METINGGQCSNEDLLRQIVRDQASADGRYRPAHGLASSCTATSWRSGQTPLTSS